MFHFIDDKAFLSNLRSACSDIINQLKQEINNDNLMEVNTYLVGSGARNLITQNGDKPVDLDYQLELLDLNGVDINDCGRIKEYVRKAFNRVLNKNGWKDCSDSTSVLSTSLRQFKKGNQTPFKIDLAIIVRNNDGRYWRLIHDKTGINRWFWNEGWHLNDFEDKVDEIKEQGLWEEVRKTYLEKKNQYLTHNDHNHPSIVCYIEAVNEIYQRIK